MASDRPEKTQGGRLGGARADFVASLGRKVADARDVLGALEADPSLVAARDELRRKLHALGAGARLLRFEAMARSLGEACAALEQSAQSGAVRPNDLAFLAQVIDDLPALAWGEAPPREREKKESDPARADYPATAAPLPFTVLVVGDESIAEALSEEAETGHTFECERTEDVQAAVGLARAYAPDIVVIDAQLDGATELTEALLEDPLTEPTPIVIVGATSESGPRFVALGVAKALPAPVPAETLRRACEDILDQRDGRTMRVTLGEPTLEALGNRLADEVRRAIVESADGPSRGVRVPLGEGTEVLGAMWGAIARIQEIIAQKTGGAVRFGGDAPEGAIAMAPWLHHELPGADRMASRGRGAAADVRLDRRRVVVADDDPGVTWFIADLLRTAGCEVFEALDGRMALDTAFRVSPELVVSDILMPGMDGFALCRALKRDVALRDTPVILLSWKEDLLQRVRELGASAAAYMRKESDSRAVVARVREVLRPRARIEARIKQAEEVRGRLDGITVRLLLELACTLRKNARVSVRDASFLYEIEMRDGAPVQATRTAPDGSFQRGPHVLAQMLGIGAGRFVVSPSHETLKAELEGSLAEQLARPLARARGALLATTGAATMHVDRVTIDAVVMADYMRATPEPAREILRQLASGTSPRQMMLGGEIAPAMIEDVLADLAARGAIVGVRGTNGADLLGPQVDAALAILEGRPAERPSYSRMPPPPVEVPVAASAGLPPSTPIGRIATKKIAVPAAPMISEEVAKDIVERYESLTMSEPPPPLVAHADDGAPSSLEDAVMREISDRASQPRVPSDPPPLVEPGALRPRSNPPTEGESEARSPVPPPADSEPGAKEQRALPSLPPDAIVPAAQSDEIPAAPPVPATLALPPVTGSAIGASETLPQELSEATEVDAPVAETKHEEEAKVEEKPAGDPLFPKTKLSPPHEPVQEKPVRVVSERTPSPASVSAGDIPKKSSWPAIAALAFIAAVVGIGVRLSSPPANQASQAAETSEPHASAQPPAPAPPPPASEQIPPGVDVPAGKGVAEITLANDDAIRVDGETRGKGPHAFVPLAPGAHEIRAGAGADEKVRRVEINPGRRAIVDLR